MTASVAIETSPFDTDIPAPAVTVALLPASPFGILKVNTAALDVPAFVTVALEPAAPVVTVPIAIVAAVPAGP